MLRSFIQYVSVRLAILVFCVLAPTSATSAAKQRLRVPAFGVGEVTLTAEKTYAAPFLEVSLDAVVTKPDGHRAKVPAFCAGGSQWRLRYSSGNYLVALYTPSLKAICHSSKIGFWSWSEQNHSNGLNFL